MHRLLPIGLKPGAHFAPYMHVLSLQPGQDFMELPALPDDKSGSVTVTNFACH